MIDQSGGKPRCILHIGMPKTGSSSIQETLDKENEIEECEYLKIGPSSNHSTIIYSLFSKRPELHHAHRAEHRTKGQVEEFVRYHKEQLRVTLTSIRSKQYIISGEDILFLDEDELSALRSYLLQFSSEIFVIAYVRPPLSFMQSAFQQNIKEGDLRFGIAGYYPQYRNRFEKFDRVFGRDNVLLIKFHPDSLLAGDVVVDFCHRIGISIKNKNIPRVNESISLEVIALLYVFYKFGRDVGYVDSWKNYKLSQDVLKFGTRKFQYSKLLAEQVRTQIAEDIQWMEARIGCSLAETIPDSDDGISSEEDLIEIAYANRDKLSEIISQKIKEQMVSPQNIADAVALLRGDYFLKAAFSNTQLARLESPEVEINDMVRELVLSLGRAGQTRAAQNILTQMSDSKMDIKKSPGADCHISFFITIKKIILSMGWVGRIKGVKNILNKISSLKCYHNKSLSADCNISYSIDRCHRGCLMGWIVDNNNPLQKLSIEIRQGHRVIAQDVADKFRQDLADAEIGDGCCAFAMKVGTVLKKDSEQLVLRVVDFNQEYKIDRSTIKEIEVG